MKKFLALILALAMVLCLVACGGGQQGGDKPTGEPTGEPSSEPAKKVYLSMFTMEGDMWGGLGDALKARFDENGYYCEILNADGDPVRQADQIDTAVTSGANLIFTVAMAPDALTEACQRAHDKGVLIYNLIWSTGVTDCVRGITSSYDQGFVETDLPIDWVKKTFPDAADGSIDCVVMGATMNSNDTDALNGILDGLKRCAAINVVETVHLNGSLAAEGMSATENMVQKYPNLKLIVCINGGEALGADEYIMSEACPITDYEHFGIFWSTLMEEHAAHLKASLENKSVMRGCTSNTTSQEATVTAAYDMMVRMLNGEDYPSFDEVPTDIVTAENLADFGY